MIYLSGKIMGLHPFEAYKLFKDREIALGEQDVFNPMDECAHLPKDSEWEQYMKACICGLIKAKEVHMLPNWKDSRGAIIEHNLAKDLGIKIVYCT